MTALEEMVKLQGNFRSTHLDVVKSRLESDIVVGTMLIDVYANCENLMDARHVVERIPEHNIVSCILDHAGRC